MTESAARATPLGEAEVSGPPAWDGFRPFEVSNIVHEAKDQRSFVLTPSEGGPVPGFQPGQYVLVEVEVAGEPLVRAYSLSDVARPDRYQVTIKRAEAPASEPGAPSGVVSSFFHGLEEGAVVGVSRPMGSFVFDPRGTSPAVLLAGGVGITPMLTMIKEVARTGSGRQVHLYYSASEAEQLVRPNELRELAEAHPNLHVHLVVSREEGSVDPDGVRPDHVGRVTFELLSRTLFSRTAEPVHYEFYLCGPEGMIASLQESLRQQGVLGRDLHSESFAPPAAPADGQGSSATPVLVPVTFTDSGTTIDWNPAERSLLQEAVRAGVEVKVGCQQGTCGMCTLDCSSGAEHVTYPPAAHLEVAQGQLLPCIARTEEPLEVSLKGRS